MSEKDNNVKNKKDNNSVKIKVKKEDDDKIKNKGFLCHSCGSTSYYEDAFGSISCTSCFTQSQTIIQTLNENDSEFKSAGGDEGGGTLINSSSAMSHRMTRIKGKKKEYKYNEHTLPTLDECIESYQRIIQIFSIRTGELVGLDDNACEVFMSNCKDIWFGYLVSFRAAAIQYGGNGKRICLRDSFLTSTRLGSLYKTLEGKELYRQRKYEILQKCIKTEDDNENVKNTNNDAYNVRSMQQDDFIQNFRHPNVVKNFSIGKESYIISNKNNNENIILPSLKNEDNINNKNNNIKKESDVIMNHNNNDNNHILPSSLKYEDNKYNNNNNIKKESDVNMNYNDNDNNRITKKDGDSTEKESDVINYKINNDDIDIKKESDTTIEKESDTTNNNDIKNDTNKKIFQEKEAALYLQLGMDVILCIMQLALQRLRAGISMSQLMNWCLGHKFPYFTAWYQLPKHIRKSSMKYCKLFYTPSSLPKIHNLYEKLNLLSIACSCSSSLSSYNILPKNMCGIVDNAPLMAARFIYDLGLINENSNGSSLVDDVIALMGITPSKNDCVIPLLRCYHTKLKTPKHIMAVIIIAIKMTIPNWKETMHILFQQSDDGDDNSNDDNNHNFYPWKESQFVHLRYNATIQSYLSSLNMGELQSLPLTHDRFENTFSRLNDSKKYQESSSIKLKEDADKDRTTLINVKTEDVDQHRTTSIKVKTEDEDQNQATSPIKVKTENEDQNQAISPIKVKRENEDHNQTTQIEVKTEEDQNQTIPPIKAKIEKEETPQNENLSPSIKVKLEDLNNNVSLFPESVHSCAISSTFTNEAQSSSSIEIENDKSNNQTLFEHNNVIAGLHSNATTSSSSKNKRKYVSFVSKKSKKRTKRTMIFSDYPSEDMLLIEFCSSYLFENPTALLSTICHMEDELIDLACRVRNKKKKKKQHDH